MKAYEAPKVEVIGSLHELTLQLNKIGTDPDVYSSVVPIVGSFYPAGPKQ